GGGGGGGREGPGGVVRGGAAAAHGESGEPSVIPALAARFADADADGGVQAAAARSLAAFGEASLAPLVAALSSPDNVRSYWAGQALLLLGRPAVKPLTSLV